MKVRTMRGDTLDMSRLIAQNEKVVALGNASMNARGDIVGQGGQVLRSRENVSQDYYNRNPKAVKQVALRDISGEVFMSPAQAMAEIAPAPKAAPKAQAPKVEAPKADTKETAPVAKRKIEDKE